MVFDINGKVALVTGGASGIGLNYAKELLRNGARGVTIADVNPEFGVKAIEELRQEFDVDKALFVVCDVTNKQQFEGAFEKTITQFRNIDILINNAGILNDKIWEKEIDINVKGTCYGVLLAIEQYLPRYKSGEDAIVVNIASIAGVRASSVVPVYSATKNAIIGMTRGWGSDHFYDLTKVRVVALCPGVTNTPMIFNVYGSTLGPKYDAWLQKQNNKTQEPEFVAAELMRVIRLAPNGTSWIVEGGRPTYQYIYADDKTMIHNVLP